MPEKELTPEELHAVRNWIYDKQNGEMVRNIYPGIENGVFQIKGEPIVIYGKDKTEFPEFGQIDDFSESTHVLLCSDKQAEELTDAGLVDFSSRDDES